MYKSILVPYDKSDHAKHALETALDLAEGNDAKITMLYVAEVPDLGDPTFAAAAQMAGMGRITENQTLEMQRDFYAKAKESLKTAVAPIVGDSKNVMYYVTSGKPQDAIAEFADTGKYDIIVMGCRGLGALRGALGSVSYAVLRSVNVPVLVVK